MVLLSIEDCTFSIRNSSPASSTPEAGESRIQQRQQQEKENTRQPQSPIYEIAPAAASAAAAAIPTTDQTIAVKADTCSTLRTLLGGSAKAHVTWKEFVEAMRDAGFIDLPQVGSVFTFLPLGEGEWESDEDEDEEDEENEDAAPADRMAITLQRAYNSEIKGGSDLLFLGRRLKRAYGWSYMTFMLA